MKHIKTFESTEDRNIYLIPYNDINLIEIILKKLKVEEHNYNIIINDLENRVFNSCYVFNLYGSWYFKNNYSKRDVKNNKKTLMALYKLKYNGELKLSDIEISANKYNL